MTTQRLLPCPFCGGADAKTTSNGEESYSAFCESCGCEGPTASTTNAAAEAWNRRAASAVQAKPDAWLITGSLAYHDDAVLTEAEADRCIAGRGKHDQSFKAPLYLQLPAADGTTPRELLERIAERGTPAGGEAFCSLCGSSRDAIAELRDHVGGSGASRGILAADESRLDDPRQDRSPSEKTARALEQAREIRRQFDSAGSLEMVAAQLRKAGAVLPAPEPDGTIEGAMLQGLCIALCLVEEQLRAIQPEADSGAPN